MEGFDGGGEDSWRVIKPRRRRIFIFYSYNKMIFSFYYN
jgi:hypothetical protein